MYCSGKTDRNISFIWVSCLCNKSQIKHHQVLVQTGFSIPCDYNNQNSLNCYIAQCGESLYTETEQHLQLSSLKLQKTERISKQISTMCITDTYFLHTSVKLKKRPIPPVNLKP